MWVSGFLSSNIVPTYCRVTKFKNGKHVSIIGQEFTYSIFSQKHNKEEPYRFIKTSKGWVSGDK